MKKSQNHPNIFAIKEKAASTSVFTLNHNTEEVVLAEIKDLDVSKVLQENDITTKVIKKMFLFQFYMLLWL